MGTYTTAAKVKSLLQRTTDFSGSTTPTSTEVEDIIARIEDEIDARTNHAWRNKSAVNEYHSPDTAYDYRTGARVKLLHRKITQLATPTDKLEVWNGNTWEDYLVTKTEGRNNGFWVNYEEGVIFIKTNYLYKEGIRVTYRYGESSVNKIVESLATKMACVEILNMYEQTLAFPDDGSSNKPNMQNRIDNWNKQIEKDFEVLSEVICIV